MAIDLEPLWDTGKPEVSEQRLRQALAGAAGDEARARYELELRRTFASATHPPQLQTPENRERARSSFEAAMTSAFVFGPLGAVAAFLAGFVRGDRNAGRATVEG